MLFRSRGKEVRALEFDRSFLGNEQGTRNMLDGSGNDTEQAGAKEPLRIRKEGRDLDRAGGAINLAVQEIVFAKLGIIRTIGELEGEARIAVLLRRGIEDVNEIGEQEVFRLGDEKVHLHLIDLGGLGEDAHTTAWADEVADLGLSDADNAIKRRGDRAIAEVDLGGLHRSWAAATLASEACVS